jgi:hypothetical protein
MYYYHLPISYKQNLKMALTEKQIIDKIEVIENNSIQVRTATIIEKDGTELTRTFHRHVVSPGADITNEDPKVQAIASSIWTEEIIAAYQASQAVGI